MSAIIRTLWDKEVPYTSTFFPGGEPHVCIERPEEIRGSYVWVDARVRTAADWVMLLAVLDAVQGLCPKLLALFLPYFPGARQDRRQPGTAFTAKVYADQLRAFALDKVVVVDPHSDVTAALLPNLLALPLTIAVPDGLRYKGVISPDAGAERRAYAAAAALDLPVVHARKQRDWKTGRLSGFSCEPLPKAGRYLVVDDICDGGGTFIGLADGIGGSLEYRVDLYVSHGIFSKGRDDLLRRYSEIYTTDSWYPGTEPAHPRFHVRELLPIVSPVMKGVISP